jgi:hypothetical protein
MRVATDSDFLADLRRSGVYSDGAETRSGGGSFTSRWVTPLDAERDLLRLTLFN